MPHENLTMSSPVTTETGSRIFYNKQGKRVWLPVEARFTGGIGSEHWIREGYTLEPKESICK